MERTINHRGIAVARENKAVFVPILGISMMSPEREKELVAKQKEKHPEWYAEYETRKAEVV